MSTTIGNGIITFGDGTQMGSFNNGTIPWAKLNTIPNLVYSNVKYNGNVNTNPDRSVDGGHGNINCGHGDFPNCNCSAYNCSGAYLNLDTGSSWDMYYYYYRCNCRCNCNCNCNC
jgi:hypothetical protein